MKQEHPRTLLTIGGSASFRVGFFPWEQKSGAFQKTNILPSCSVTRMVHSFSEMRQMSDADALFQSDEWLAQPFYDILIVTDLFESVPVSLALKILDRLLGKAKNQVLVLCPKLSVGTAGGINNGRRIYHPVVFQSYDFSYLLLGREHENQTQLYSFYPKRQTQGFTEAPAPKSAVSAPYPLRLAYILPDQDLTGGMKQLLVQIKEMHRRGHRVFVYNKSATAQSALPKWSDLTADDVDGEFVLTPSEDYLEHIGQVDAIILGWMEQVPEVRGASPPVFLWEQGSSPLFGDFGKLLASTSTVLVRFRSYYRSPVQLLSVSTLVQTILKARFERDSVLVPPAVDTFPVLPEKPDRVIKQILLVGNGEMEFKNFSFAINALVKARSNGLKFEVQWVTPTQPAKDMVPKSLNVVYHVAPPQEKLAVLYGAADLFVSHSLYEAFSLPPLEAMAAGTAVLAVNNGGVETYAVPGENCLICEQGDLPGFMRLMEQLLKDDEMRERLVKNGRITANRFSVRNMCDSLESSLHNMVGRLK